MKHDSHPHELKDATMLGENPKIPCFSCKLPTFGNCYACTKCKFYLHEFCFELPKSANFRSHPEHALDLLYHEPAQTDCDACGDSCNGFTYSCSTCNFNLHVNCASLLNSRPQNDRDHYIAMFLKHKLVDMKSLKSELGSSNVELESLKRELGSLKAKIGSTNSNYPSVNRNQDPKPTQPTHNATPNAPPRSTQPANTAQPTIPVQTTQASSSQQNQPSMIKHFSHPHVLKAMEVDQKDGKICSACECYLKGSSYLCTASKCTFCLHKACFDSPREVKHKSHLQHPLKLLTSPPYADGFTCNACFRSGKAFAYHCATCKYDLHTDCIQWPEAVKRSDHSHALKLYYSSKSVYGNNRPNVTFMCDACMNPVHEMAWMYYCSECDFGTHLECINTAVTAGGGNGGQSAQNSLTETELRFAMLQLLLQAQATQAVLGLF